MGNQTVATPLKTLLTPVAMNFQQLLAQGRGFMLCFNWLDLVQETIAVMICKYHGMSHLEDGIS